MEDGDSPVLSLVTKLYRALHSDTSLSELEIPEGCHVVWRGECLLVVSEDESIEVRLNVPENVTISMEGDKIRVRRKRGSNESPEARLLQTIKRFRTRIRGPDPSKNRHEEVPTEVAVPPILEVDVPTLLEMEYSMSRISYLFGRAELKRALLALVLAKTAVICAARNVASEPTGLVKSERADVLVSPYLRIGRRITGLDAFRGRRIISLDEVPEGVRIQWLNWKYLARVMAWGIDGITSRIGWNDSDLAVGYVDTHSSLYAYYLSALLDVPLFDFSYLWFLRLRTKLPRRKLWKDEQGKSHYLFWTQIKALEELGVEDVILLGTREECRGWTAECIRKDAEVRVIEAYGKDIEELALRVEELAEIMGAETRDRKPITPPRFKIPYRLGPLSGCPLLEAYLLMAELAEQRTLPIVKGL